MKNSTHAFLQRRQHRKARHTANVKPNAVPNAVPPRPNRAADRRSSTNCGKTIHHFFPTCLTACVRWKTVAEVGLYPGGTPAGGDHAVRVQQGSRNALNNKRKEKKFRKHYQRLFKLRLPHLDTVHHVLCRLPDTELEQLKHTLVKTLLRRRCCISTRLFERWLWWRWMPPGW